MTIARYHFKFYRSVKFSINFQCYVLNYSLERQNVQYIIYLRTHTAMQDHKVLYHVARLKAMQFENRYLSVRLGQRYCLSPSFSLINSRTHRTTKIQEFYNQVPSYSIHLSFRVFYNRRPLVEWTRDACSDIRCAAENTKSDSLIENLGFKISLKARCVEAPAWEDHFMNVIRHTCVISSFHLKLR